MEPRAFWTASDVTGALAELAACKRAAAHLLAGWIVKARDIELKEALAQHAFVDLDHALRVQRRLRAIDRLDPAAAVPPELCTWLEGIDRAADIADVVAALYFLVRPRILERAREIIERTDPLLDAATVRLLRELAREEEDLAAWAEAAPAAASWRARAGELRPGFVEAREGRGPRRALSDVAWRPVDRVPQARRPEGWTLGKPGAMKVLPTNPLSDPHDIAVFLHTSICEELTTMELVARNSYEHPDLPLAFHHDMLRQASDEARHSAALRRLIGTHGLSYGDLPVYTGSYDTMYEFAETPPGSREELVWRILLRQTFHEGLALDSLAVEVKQRLHLHQTAMANAYGFLLADEILHVESGLRWSRFLCGDDAERAMHERARAHDAFKRKLEERRSRFVDEHPAEALAEVERLAEKKISFDRPRQFGKVLNRAAREAVGFLEVEIQQVLSWGYMVE